MKQIETIGKGANYSATDFGRLADIKDYVLELGPEVKIPGKVFGGQAVGATGAEFSFQVFAPGTQTGFLHTHTTHEELYFFLAGKGEMQVDGTIVAVQEGSVVRVAPAGRRSVANKALVMLCVQYRADAFTAADATDGTLLPDPVQW